jgi:hypothetical protein
MSMLSGIERCTDKVHSPTVSGQTLVCNNEPKVILQPGQKWGVLAILGGEVYCRRCVLLLTLVLAELFLSFCFPISPRHFPNPLNCVVLCACSFLLKCALSSSDSEVLGVSSRCQFDVKNRLPLSAFRLRSLLLT